MSTSWHSVHSKIIEIEENFNNRSLRERVLIALGLLSLIYVVWVFAFYSAIELKKENLDERLVTAQKNMNKVLAQEKVFSHALVNDPNAEIKYDILQLKEKLKSLDDNLQGLSVGLIPASEFASVVEDLLATNTRLTLLGMTTLKPVKLSFGDNDNVDVAVKADQELSGQSESQNPQDIIKKLTDLEQEKTNTLPEKEGLSDNDGIGVYKHAVRVNISGKYFDIVDYLDALEDLSWTFYWSEIDYKVSEKGGVSPDANVTFEIYTLSTDTGVFGA